MSCLDLVWSLFERYKIDQRIKRLATPANVWITKPPWEDTASLTYAETWARFLDAIGPCPSPLRPSEEYVRGCLYRGGLWKARLRWWDGEVARAFAVVHCKNKLPVHLPKELVKMILGMIKHGHFIR